MTQLQNLEAAVDSGSIDDMECMRLLTAINPTVILFIAKCWAYLSPIDQAVLTGTIERIEDKCDTGGGGGDPYPFEPPVHT